MTVLHIAASEGHLDCLQLLIEQYGFDANQQSKLNNWAPVHLCCGHFDHHRALRCLNYLLSVGANPSLYDINLLSNSISLLRSSRQSYRQGDNGVICRRRHVVGTHHEL